MCSSCAHMPEPTWSHLDAVGFWGALGPTKPVQRRSACQAPMQIIAIIISVLWLGKNCQRTCRKASSSRAPRRCPAETTCFTDRSAPDTIQFTTEYTRCKDRGSLTSPSRSFHGVFYVSPYPLFLLTLPPVLRFKHRMHFLFLFIYLLPDVCYRLRGGFQSARPRCICLCSWHLSQW